MQEPIPRLPEGPPATADLCAGEVDPMLAEFISLLGTPPPPAPLDVKVLSVESLPPHTRKLVEYGTVGQERGQAYLLVPVALEGKASGILAIHQDGGSRPYSFGKSEPAGLGGDPELAYGRELCERGYVVICPDRFPFESRSLARSKYKAVFDEFRIGTHLSEWDMDLDLTEDLYAGCVANRLLFEGWSQLGKSLFELKRAVDVLCLQPEVDASRLGAIGHSAGGFFTVLAMYVDARLKAGCSSTGPFLIRDVYSAEYLRPINGFGSALAVPGLKQWGDVDDIVAGLAPRPFLETCGEQGESAEERDPLWAKVRAKYAQLGVSERLQTKVYPGGHEFRKDMRELSYDWFDRWLRE